MRRPGIGTPGEDHRPRDLKLCLLYRADLATGEAAAWLAQTIDAIAGGAQAERAQDGGIRDERPAEFEVGGKPGGGAPPEVWFRVAPATPPPFSARTHESFDAKLLLAVRKWGTRTLFLDLEQRRVDDWSPRRGEHTQELLDRAPGQVAFHPVLLRGEFVPEAELEERRARWLAAVTAAHAAALERLRAEHPGAWALMMPATHIDRRGMHISPGERVIGIHASEAECERAAEDYRGLCYVVNLATGANVSRWAER